MIIVLHKESQTVQFENDDERESFFGELTIVESMTFFFISAINDLKARGFVPMLIEKAAKYINTIPFDLILRINMSLD